MSDRRRSMPNRAAKRKASEDDMPTGGETKKAKAEKVQEVEEEVEVEDEDYTQQSLAYRWIDHGKPSSVNSQTEHQLLEMVLNGVSEIFTVGDCVLLRADSGSEDEAFVAKIERMWQISAKKNKAKFPEYLMKVRTRWFFKKSDVEELGGNFAHASLKKSEVLANMTDKDVILSNQADDNDVLTLLGKCTIIHREPKSLVPDQLPPRTFVCRYSLLFAETTGLAEIKPYRGENQPWPDKVRKEESKGEDGDEEKNEGEEDEPMEGSVKQGQKKEEQKAKADAENEGQGVQEEEEEEEEEKDPAKGTKKVQVDPEEKGPEKVEEAQKKVESNEGDGVGMQDGGEGQEEDKGEKETQDENLEEKTKENSLDAEQQQQQQQKPGEKQGGKVDAGEKSSAVSSLLPGITHRSNTDPAVAPDSSDEETSVAESSEGSSVGMDGEGMGTNLDEGSNTKGKIMVGPEHQVPVPEYDPKGKIVSRKPTQVWKQDSGADLDAYFRGASAIINGVLRDQSLWMTEQYLPLPQEKMHLLNETEMTISKLSTASSMSQNRLTRECNLDAVLALLHNKDYDTKAALREIAANPTKYITKWTPSEKDSFNHGFRKFSGSLRMITKSLSLGTKDFKDVVDYHYRFKIPDQFRKRQDRKRSYAIRMMEILEDRRAGNDTYIPLRHESVKGDWPRKQVSDPDGDMQARRAGAKEFLIQVKATLGDEKLRQLAIAIKSGCRMSDLKDRAVDILQDTPSLLNKFVQYLPKRYRE